MILLDLGACVGDFTEVWLHANPEGHVICVEPNPDNIAKLKEQYADDPRVRIAEYAVSFFPSSGQEFYFGTALTNGSLSPHGEAQRYIVSVKNETLKTARVRCVTIQNIIDEYAIDISSCTIKIDVEGFEHRLLYDLLGKYFYGGHTVDAVDKKLPYKIYMDDGCRKIVSEVEWRDRIRFYHLVTKQKPELEDRIFIETCVDENDPRILELTRQAEDSTKLLGYAPFKDHYAVKALCTPELALNQFEEEGVDQLVEMCNESEYVRELIMHHATVGVAYCFDHVFVHQVIFVCDMLQPGINVDEMQRLISYAETDAARLINIDTQKSDMVFGVPHMLFIGIDRGSTSGSPFVPLTILSTQFMTSSPSLPTVLTTASPRIDREESLHDTVERRYNSKYMFHDAVEHVARSFTN